MLNNAVLQKGGSLLIDGNGSLQVDGQASIGDGGFPGASGIGLLAINSGTATLGSALLGNSTNAYGAIGLNGGSLLVTSNLNVAAQFGSTGLVSMTSGKLINTNSVLVIGAGGNGTFVQIGGTNQASAVTLGGATGSQGFYSVSNAVFSGTTLSIGSSNGGLGNLLIQSNAAVNVSSNINIVSGSLVSTSSVSLSGGSMIASNAPIRVGPVGNGQLLISGGNHTFRQIKLGGTNGLGSGFFHMSGGSLKILGIGTGPGDGLDSNGVDQDGGDLDGSGTSFTIGNYHDSSAYLSGTGQYDNVYVGYGAGFTGNYTQTGGVLYVYNSMIVGQLYADFISGADCFGTNAAVGNVALNAGTLYVTNDTHTAVLDVRDGTFTLSPGATLVVDNLIMTNACGLFMNTGGDLQCNNPPTLLPRIVPVLTPTNLSLGFQTINATTNYVEQETNLAGSNWVRYFTNVGSGYFTNISITPTGQPRFFRIRQQ